MNVERRSFEEAEGRVGGQGRLFSPGLTTGFPRMRVFGPFGEHVGLRQVLTIAMAAATYGASIVAAGGGGVVGVVVALFGFAVTIACFVSGGVVGQWIGRKSLGRFEAAVPGQRLPHERRSLAGSDLRLVNVSGVELLSLDLRGANLRGANLSSARFEDSDFRGADLRGAILAGADLSGSDLSGADLTQATLDGAVLRNCDLRSANLAFSSARGVQLNYADLRGAILLGLNLSGATLHGALFDEDADQELGGVDEFWPAMLTEPKS